MSKSNGSWKKVPIKEIYRGFYDGPHATPTPTDRGPIFLSIKNITEDGHLDLSDIKHISEQEFPRWTKRVLPQHGDIVFTYEATLHRYAIVPKDFRGCLGRRVALIRPKTQKIDSKFLLYYFFGEEWYSLIKEKTISGSTVDRIPLIDFPNFEISLPPLSIQKKIAAVLSAYDDLIENNDRRIALLEKTAEGIYREWFVRLRFPGFDRATFHKGIPEGWEMAKLESIASFLMGQSPKSEFYNSLGDGLPFHQGVGTYGSRFPRKEVYCSVKGRLANKGDILFSVRAPVGRLNIADCEMVIGRGLASIRHKEECNSYLFYLLKNNFSDEDIIGNGSIFNSVGKDELLSFQILNPPNLIVKEFNRVAEKIDLQIENLYKTVDALKQTRDRLLTRLISGKLSVEDLDIQFPPSMTTDS